MQLANCLVGVVVGMGAVGVEVEMQLCFSILCFDATLWRKYEERKKIGVCSDHVVGSLQSDPLKFPVLDECQS
jgi:hypothetical protein